MLRTIDRYVIREVIPPFLLSLVIFTFILVIPPIMRNLESLLAKGVAWQTAVQIILTLVPQGLGITIPMALLTGLLIGLGRLSADREAVALLACGVSPYRLLRPILLLAALCTGATAYVIIEAIPDANQKFRDITFDVIMKRVAEDIRPRVFFEDFPGWVLYARQEAPPGSPWAWEDVLVADTRTPGSTKLILARHGRLNLDRDARHVSLALEDGTQYVTGKPGETTTISFAGRSTFNLDADTVFPRFELPRTVTEFTIPQLQEQIAERRRATLEAAPDGPVLSPHNEIIYLHQKFSIPFACMVFGIIGLALGLSVARDGKLAGFVVGTLIIFAYYIVMYLAEGAVKGFYTTHEAVAGPMYFAHLARWLPNIVLGVFGIAALVWRARYAERGLPVRVPAFIPALTSRWRRGQAPDGADAARPDGTAPRGRRKTVVVIRLPRLRLPGAPGILDKYIASLYLRVVGLSFLALLGLFYIATFIDRAEKLFKGQATLGMMMQLLVYQTPQYIYYVIPIAALLSVLVTFGLLARTSELTVMKACGISLYRIAAPVIALSILGSALLFGLEQEILATANRRAEVLDNTIRGRPTTTFNPLHRRWIIGRDGSIYHYHYFDIQRNALNGLSVFRLAEGDWRLETQTFAGEAVHAAEGWVGLRGWTQQLDTKPPQWTTFDRQVLALEAPDYFQTEQPAAEMMTVRELREDIAHLEASGFNAIPAQVELHRKLAFPFVTLALTLLAIPFGVTTGRKGALYGIGLGIGLALSYWILFLVFVAIGRAGLLPPALAAWTTNIIVIGTAAYLLLRART
jgi:LPS export ABC transporter permease LptG/LPS export ABC transporter permease LptF